MKYGEPKNETNAKRKNGQTTRKWNKSKYVSCTSNWRRKEKYSNNTRKQDTKNCWKTSRS